MMTIIKNAASISHYPHKALKAGVVDALSKAIAAHRYSVLASPLLKYFEAYCDLTNLTVTTRSLGEAKFLAIVKGFLGALIADDFLGVTKSARVRLAKIFVEIAIDISRPGQVSVSSENLIWEPSLFEDIWKSQKDRIAESKLKYWCGWQVKSRKGACTYLAIPVIWDSHGRSFAQTLYQQYKDHMQSHARVDPHSFNEMLSFLNANSATWPSTTFDNPVEIHKFFQHFMLHYFNSAVDQKLHIPSRIKQYRRLISLINQAFIESGVWAKPFLGELIAPSSKGTSNHETHISITKDGELLKDKLITPIPLHITDSEAIELLFETIGDDVEVVAKWARMKTYELRKRQKRRDALARIGVPIEPTTNRKSIKENLNEADICATFVKYGLPYIRNFLTAHRHGQRVNRSAIAPTLALPGVFDLLPFKLLLVHHDQRITESFLDQLELYNSISQLSGFLRTETGEHQLVGYKDRKGPESSEQKITLSARQAVLIRQVIEITNPLRNELKAAGDDSWRYLFLHSARSLSYPRVSKGIGLGSRVLPAHMEELMDEFSKFSHHPKEKLRKLISKISVTSYRASCAVLVFLSTKSSSDMAQALGHEKFKADLLSRYLPEAILDFFQSRWIRIFQKGIICEAMKDSPYLLEVSKFENMNDLHSFLANHAIKEIPHHLQEPKDNLDDFIGSANQKADSVAISVNCDILAALLSIAREVRHPSKSAPISGLAVYWTEFTELLVKEIERGWDEDLKTQLATATDKINIISGSIIYAPTTRT
ncbi:hypothetical protein PA6566_01219 [Pseudomonas aeruginosa]|jgi:hypothetical protein|uniref:hypothetical protein n=1 Tax=Pseudomonas aeruginosa TaxID=287 RepID=UPI0037CBF226